MLVYGIDWLYCFYPVSQYMQFDSVLSRHQNKTPLYYNTWWFLLVLHQFVGKVIDRKYMWVQVPASDKAINKFGKFNINTKNCLIAPNLFYFTGCQTPFDSFYKIKDTLCRRVSFLLTQ